jgi:2-polyprenyl-3-methyl-5-hydroxy-6-metoxy-1,4-benzoquinol methylase
VIDQDKTNLSEKELFYENMADKFDSVMNMYDTTTRLKVIYDKLLADFDLNGKLLLDAGCGTGWFSREACKRGAEVVSIDVGTGLLGKVAEKCSSNRVAASILNLPFSDNTYDYVVSSDVIEHTQDPAMSLGELIRVLKPEGVLAVTVPNKLWKPALWAAEILKTRPYQGLENWLGPIEFMQIVENYGCEILQKRGVHLFPFVFSFTHGFLNWFDNYGEDFYHIMLNLCLLGRKNKSFH